MPKISGAHRDHLASGGLWPAPSTTTEPNEVPEPLPIHAISVSHTPTPLLVTRPLAQTNKYPQLSHLLAIFSLPLSFPVYHHNFSRSVLVLYARLQATFFITSFFLL